MTKITIPKAETKKCTIPSVVGGEFTECIKTEVTLFEDRKVIVYVPKHLNATEHLDYYGNIFKGVGWVSWGEVN